MNKIFSLCLAVLVSSNLIGCNSTTDVEQQPYVPLEIQANELVKVIFDSELVANSVGIQSASIDKATGSSRAIVNIKNTAGVPWTIEYQTTWYDNIGVPQQSSASWKRKSLPANGEFTILDMAKQPDLTNVKLHFRVPSDVEIWIPKENPIEKYKQQQQASNN